MKTTYRCARCGGKMNIEAFPGLREGEMEADVEPCKTCLDELEDKIDDLEIELGK